MINLTTYLRKDYTDKNGKSPVIIRFWLNKERIELSVKVKVTPENWDAKKRIVKKAEKDAIDKNTMIEQARAQINSIMIKYRLSGIPLTGELIKSEFKNPVNHADFIVWMEDEIRHRTGLLTQSTLRHHLSVHSSIREFMDSMRFSNITKTTIEEYEKFLRLKKHNRMTTIEKKLKVFKCYLNRAIEKNLLTENPFKKIKIKKGKFNFEYLEDFEFRLLLEYYLDKNCPANHKKALRPFIFSCCTGLRLSDVKSIKHENIINNMIVVSPKKLRNVNNDIVKIPLNPFTKKIIRDAGEFRIAGKIFETYSDQKTNEYLKKIAKKLEIPKKIKFNMGRHTFATLFLLENKDVTTLQKLLGHSNIQQTLVYAHVTDTAVKNHSDNFFNKYTRDLI